jgi:hypothetical protein
MNFNLETIIRSALRKITFLNLGTDYLVTQFVAHIFGHAFFAFILLSLPYGIWFALLPTIYSFAKEMFIDGHGFGVFKDLDGRTDMLSRLVGSLIPYLTFIWR